jgi:hypothetical protein
LIFDFAIDPIIRKISERNKDDGYWRLIGNDNICEVMQAYADGIDLFSETREGMERIINTFLCFFYIQGSRLAYQKVKHSMSLEEEQKKKIRLKR